MLNTVLITGSAGFIGFHLTKRLLESNYQVVGVDNLNDYYDPELKNNRTKILKDFKGFVFHHADINRFTDLELIFKNHSFDIVCHLAAQAGVPFSLKNPFIYEETNIRGTLNLLELMKKSKIDRLVYASSSSVYGGQNKMPYREETVVDRPVSLYAATKVATELLAHVYHRLYGFRTIGLRYFSAYGPWGRPDMALFIFTRAILNDQPIKVYHYGKMERDFTFIDDIVDGTVRALEKIDLFDDEIFNLGSARPVKLVEFIKIIEDVLGKKARRKYLPMRLGDVEKSFADITKAKKLLGYEPKVSINDGVKEFVKWYKQYYGQV